MRIWGTYLDVDPCFPQKIRPQCNFEPTDEHGLIGYPIVVDGSDTPIQCVCGRPRVRPCNVPSAHLCHGELHRKVATPCYVLKGSKGPRARLVKTRDEIERVLRDHAAEMRFRKPIPVRAVSGGRVEKETAISEVVLRGAFRENEQRAPARGHFEFVAHPIRPGADDDLSAPHPASLEQ